MRNIIMLVMGSALLIPDSASACHRRYSCSGYGCYGNTGCYGSTGCFGRGGCHGGYYSGCYGAAGGHRAYAGGYYSNGYASSYYVYPGAAYYSPNTYYPPYSNGTTSRTSAYYDPNPGYNGNKVINKDRQAQVEVILPDANADLIIQDQKTNTVGLRRSFISPELEQGKKFTYTMKLLRNNAGRMEDDTRTIEVQAGSIVTVDFTKPKTDGVNPWTGSKNNQLPTPDASKHDKAPVPSSNIIPLPRK